MRWDKYFLQAAYRIYIGLKELQIRAANRAGRFIKNVLNYFYRVLNNIINMIRKLRQSANAGRVRGKSTGRLHTAVNYLRRGIQTGGDTTFAAKVAVSAFSVFMGFFVLLLCVYVIIPSVISGAAHYIEHDLAIKMYNRTLKENEIAAVSTSNQQTVLPRDCFSSVLKQNPDIAGRLTISGLNLGYLVTQHTDNTYYLHTDYNRKPGSLGTIFLDCMCSAKASPPRGHYILYGKNMPDGTMFGSLKKFGDADFFKANDTLRFDTLYGDFEWTVFSAYKAAPGDSFSANFPSLGSEKWLAYLQQLAEKSINNKDISFTQNDVLLTLCTDALSSGTRFVVHAKLIR